VLRGTQAYRRWRISIEASSSDDCTAIEQNDEPKTENDNEN